MSFFTLQDPCKFFLAFNHQKNCAVILVKDIFSLSSNKTRIMRATFLYVRCKQTLKTLVRIVWEILTPVCCDYSMGFSSYPQACHGKLVTKFWLAKSLVLHTKRLFDCSEAFAWSLHATRSLVQVVIALHDDNFWGGIAILDALWDMGEPQTFTKRKCWVLFILIYSVISLYSLLGFQGNNYILEYCREKFV